MVTLQPFAHLSPVVSIYILMFSCWSSKNINKLSSLYASHDIYNRNTILWTRKSFLKICLRTSCISLHLDILKIKLICFLVYTIAPVGLSCRLLLLNKQEVDFNLDFRYNIATYFEVKSRSGERPSATHNIGDSFPNESASLNKTVLQMIQWLAQFSSWLNLSFWTNRLN